MRLPIPGRRSSQQDWAKRVCEKLRSAETIEEQARIIMEELGDGTPPILWPEVAAAVHGEFKDAVEKCVADTCLPPILCVPLLPEGYVDEERFTRVVTRAAEAIAARSNARSMTKLYLKYRVKSKGAIKKLKEVARACLASQT